MLALSFSTLHAQSPQQIIQQAVDGERKADQNDHSNWIYLEESDKPKEHIVQWVAATQRGNVERVLEKDEQQLPEARQRDLIEKFLHDTKAQNKQIAEANHDNQQIDDLLKLLPAPLSGHKPDRPQPRPHCTSNPHQTSIRLRARHVYSAA